MAIAGSQFLALSRYRLSSPGALTGVKPSITATTGFSATLARLFTPVTTPAATMAIVTQTPLHGYADGFKSAQIYSTVDPLNGAVKAALAPAALLPSLVVSPATTPEQYRPIDPTVRPGFVTGTIPASNPLPQTTDAARVVEPENAAGTPTRARAADTKRILTLAAIAVIVYLAIK